MEEEEEVVRFRGFFCFTKCAVMYRITVAYVKFVACLDPLCIWRLRVAVSVIKARSE